MKFYTFIFLGMFLGIFACKAVKESELSSLYPEDSALERRRPATAEEAGWLIRPRVASAFLLSENLMMTNHHVPVEVGTTINSGPAIMNSKLYGDVRVVKVVESSEELDYAIYEIIWQKGYEHSSPSNITAKDEYETGQATAPPKPKNPVEEALMVTGISNWTDAKSIELWKNLQSSKENFNSSEEERAFVKSELNRLEAIGSAAELAFAVDRLAMLLPQTRKHVELEINRRETEARQPRKIPDAMKVVRCLAKKAELVFGEKFDSGTKVFTVGYPYDVERSVPTVSYGSIRKIPNNDRFKDSRVDLRFDIGIVGGNSGGPVLTLDGEKLVGIATLSRSNTNEIMVSADRTNLSGGASVWQIYEASPTLRRVFPLPGLCRN